MSYGEKRQAVRAGAVEPPSNGKRVFQIAYDEMLLIRNGGYEVGSALWNDSAKRILEKRERYRLFIIGQAASRETREEMVRRTFRTDCDCSIHPLLRI